MKKITLAYLAGLVDGEGYVGIKKSHRKDSVSPLYHERIQVRMVHEPSIRLLTRTLGGNYYGEKPNAHKGRPLFCWQASDAMACRILRALLPYLVIKRASALTVLGLRKSKENPEARIRGGPNARVMRPRVLRTRERLYLRCKALNRVGI